MDDLRYELDESTALMGHFVLKHNQALKQLKLFKDKIRTEDLSYGNRRQELENEYQQTSILLNEMKFHYEDLEKSIQANKTEIKEMHDLCNNLENELHDVVLNNARLQSNLRSIREKILLIKAIYEAKKVELGKKFSSNKN